MIALSLAGAAVMLWQPRLGLPLPDKGAEWLGLGAGFLFALSNVLIRRTPQHSIELKSTAVFLCTVAWVPSPRCSSRRPLLGGMTPVHWVLVACVGVVLLVVNLVVQFGLTHVPANRAIVIFMFELAVAAVSAWLLAGEAMGAKEWLGGAHDRRRQRGLGAGGGRRRRAQSARCGFGQDRLIELVAGVGHHRQDQREQRQQQDAADGRRPTAACAQLMAAVKLRKTMRTLVTTAATRSARRSHSSGTEKAEIAKSSSAITAPEIRPQSMKEVTLAGDGNEVRGEDRVAADHVAVENRDVGDEDHEEQGADQGDDPDRGRGAGEAGGHRREAHGLAGMGVAGDGEEAGEDRRPHQHEGAGGGDDEGGAAGGDQGADDECADDGEDAGVGDADRARRVGRAPAARECVGDRFECQRSFGHGRFPPCFPRMPRGYSVMLRAIMVSKRRPSLPAARGGCVAWYSDWR